MKKSLKVSNFIIFTWKKELNKLLNSWLKVLIAVLMFATVLIASSLVGYQITNELLHSFFEANDLNIIFLLVVSMLINTSIITVLLFLVFKMLTPDHDLYSKMFSWLPVNKAEINMGLFIPYFIVICAIIVLFSVILIIPSLIVNGFGFFNIILLYISMMTQVLLVASITSFVYNLLFYFGNKMGIPFTKHLSIIIIFLLISLLLPYILEFRNYANLANHYQTNFFYLMAPVFLYGSNLIPDFRTTELIFSIGIFTSIVIMNIITFRLPSFTEKPFFEPVSVIKFGKSKYKNIVINEILSQSREMNNLLNIFIFWSLIVVLKVKFPSGMDGVIVILLAALTGIIAFNSYSNCKSYLPLYKLYSFSYLHVFCGKVLGLMILAIVQFWLLIVSTLTFLASFSIYGYAALAIFNSTMIFFTIGLIFPTTKNNTLTSVLTLFILILFAFPLALIIGKIYSLLSLYGIIMLVMFIEISIVIFVINTFKWRFHNEYR